MLKLISNQENVNLKAQWNITLYTTYMHKFKSLKMLLDVNLADLYMGEKNSSITVAIKKKWGYKQARNIGESLDTWIKMHKLTETTMSKLWPKWPERRPLSRSEPFFQKELQRNSKLRVSKLKGQDNGQNNSIKTIHQTPVNMPVLVLLLLRQKNKAAENRGTCFPGWSIKNFFPNKGDSFLRGPLA